MLVFDFIIAKGIMLVLDFKGFSLRRLRSVVPLDVKRGSCMLQDIFPIRSPTHASPLGPQAYLPTSHASPKPEHRQHPKPKLPNPKAGALISSLFGLLATKSNPNPQLKISSLFGLLPCSVSFPILN